MSNETLLYYVLPAIGLVYDLATGVYALMNKRDPRSQLGWLVICIFVPVIGATCFWLFGNNRIQTRARRWQVAGRFERGPDEADHSMEAVAASFADAHPEQLRTLQGLLSTSKRVTERPLLSGNTVTALYNGEQAFPDMLSAIDSAERYVFLCAYLFDTPGIGREFIAALGRAAERGAKVWVLVDAIGERYSRPRASKLLRKEKGVRVERFLPLALSIRGLGINLRNHRKLLVVDGRVGFTGGMNIGARHLVEDEKNKNKTQDVHFRVEGPALYALEQVFLEDWWFTRDAYEEPPGRASLSIERGRALCRGIKDGPNEDFEALQWIIVGALSCAQRTIRIMTPYFIPSRELLAALNAAVLRGVEVDIILPKKNNQAIVAWAAQSMLWEVVRYGIAVHYQPPPFNHAKLLIVDELYVNLGSTNLDPRSLRLNFEFNLEVYDTGLASELISYFDQIKDRSERVTGESLENLGFFVRLRDSLAKLFAPYL